MQTVAGGSTAPGRSPTRIGVPETGQTPPRPRPPILAKEEAACRAALLCDLQRALTAQGVGSVLASRHRLVLEGSSTKCAPSGPVDPQLHVFTPGGTTIVTTNGRAYLLRGRACPADDPAQAADMVRRAADSGVR